MTAERKAVRMGCSLILATLVALPVSAQTLQADETGEQAILAEIKNLKRKIEQSRKEIAESEDRIATILKSLNLQTSAKKESPSNSSNQGQTPGSIGSLKDQAFIGKKQDTTPFVASGQESTIASSYRSNVELSAKTDSSKASINLNVLAQKLPPARRQGNSTIEDTWFATVALTASAPLAKNSERTELYSLNGPEDGFSFGLNANLLRFRFRDNNPVLGDDVEIRLNRIRRLEALLGPHAMAVCIRFEEKKTPPTTDPLTVCERRRDTNPPIAFNGTEQTSSRDFIETYLNSDFISNSGIESNVTGQFPTGWEASLRELNSLGKLGSFDDAVINLGLNASLSYNEFKFFDTVSREVEKDEGRLGFDASITAGLIYPKKGFSFNGSVGFQRNYKDQDDFAVCPVDISVGEQLDCPVNAFGTPKRDDSALVRGEFRYILGKKFAISPTVVYDVTDSDFRAELPIYLISNEDGGLSGGIRAGYDTEDENEFIFGVFVSSPFEL